MCDPQDFPPYEDPRAAKRREQARIRKQRQRQRERIARVHAPHTAAAAPRRPEGWQAEPPEPWWDRLEALPLREAWFARGLRLPMTGPQTRLIARWARRGAAYVALCLGIREAPRRGPTYNVVALALSKALTVASARAVIGAVVSAAPAPMPSLPVPQGNAASAPGSPGTGWEALRAVAERMGWVR